MMTEKRQAISAGGEASGKMGAVFLPQVRWLVAFRTFAYPTFVLALTKWFVLTSELFRLRRVT